MIEADPAYPGLCFDVDGDFRFLMDAKALAKLPRHEVKKGSWLGGLVVDAQGRAFRIETIEQLEDPSEGVLSKLFGIGRSLSVPVACSLVSTEAISLDAVKVKVCFAVEHYAGCFDDEAPAGESSEPKDERSELMTAVRSAASVPDIIAKIEAWAEPPD